jgi:uncharacterized membrane protein YeaQ/YmgE (transglycosylase-associated protein family)
MKNGISGLCILTIIVAIIGLSIMVAIGSIMNNKQEKFNDDYLTYNTYTANANVTRVDPNIKYRNYLLYGTFSLQYNNKTYTGTFKITREEPVISSITVYYYKDLDIFSTDKPQFSNTGFFLVVIGSVVLSAVMCISCVLISRQLIHLKNVGSSKEEKRYVNYIV